MTGTDIEAASDFGDLVGNAPAWTRNGGRNKQQRGKFEGAKPLAHRREGVTPPGCAADQGPSELRQSRDVQFMSRLASITFPWPLRIAAGAFF